MGSLSAPELLLVAGVLILLFGAKKLPEMARSLGKAKGEFKKGLDEGEVQKSQETPGAPAEAGPKPGAGVPQNQAGGNGTPQP